MTNADRDALERLPAPDEVRLALSRRIREAHVLRRLLRLSEHAASELGDSGHADSGNRVQIGQGVSRA